MSEPPPQTEVAIIGGGVIGASIAFHLAEAGVEVTLFERGAPGAGASGSSAGVVRTYFPGDVTNGALAVRSLPAYQAFHSRPGAEPAFRQVGFLVLFSELAQLDAFGADVAAQRAAGVEVELIDARQASELNPFLAPDGIRAAAWAPQAFVCEPREIVRGYAEAAAGRGARLCVNTAVATVGVRNGLIGTEYGETRAQAIVCAAGPWSQAIAAMCGVHLPVSPRRTELLLTDPLPRQAARIPLTMHAASGLRMRAFGEQLLIGMGRPVPGEERAAWLQRVAAQLGKTCPRLAGIGLHSAWSGVWDGTPSGTAFIGERTGPGRFLYAAGFSGHGFCQAPVVGEIVRDLYLRRPPGVNLAPFSTERGAEPRR
jgi:sarcosine oxidase subunit beta